MICYATCCVQHGSWSHAVAGGRGEGAKCRLCVLNCLILDTNVHWVYCTHCDCSVNSSSKNQSRLWSAKMISSPQSDSLDNSLDTQPSEDRQNTITEQKHLCLIYVCICVNTLAQLPASIIITVFVCDFINSYLLFLFVPYYGFINSYLLFLPFLYGNNTFMRLYDLSYVTVMHAW